MITFAIVLMLSILALSGGYFCYLCSQSDLIVIKSPGREFTIDCSRWFRRGGSCEEFCSTSKTTDISVEK
jgi:hypothetical protein